MEERRELTCIRCPLGCLVTVTLRDGEVVDVRGNTCPRGEAYARREVSDPVRTVTTTVPVTGSATELMLSVKTAGDIPKDRVWECMRALSHVTAQAPVEIGDVVLANVCGTGIDVVATKRA